MSGINNFWKITSERIIRELNLENFKNLASVRTIPIYGHGDSYGVKDFFHEPYVKEMGWLINKRSPSEQKKWKEILKEPQRGHNERSHEAAKIFLTGIGDETMTETSAWTIKSAHHVLTYEDISKKSILEFDQIIEMGAGIGETARIILDAGFKKPYRILDLSEVYKISSYYLSDYQNVSFHNHYATIPATKNTLFIGTWSFSEVDFSYRDEIAEYFKGSADFLLVWQEVVYDCDNRTYFTKILPEKLNTYQWSQRPIRPWPGINLVRSNYLVGVIHD